MDEFVLFFFGYKVSNQYQSGNVLTEIDAFHLGRENVEERKDRKDQNKKNRMTMILGGVGKFPCRINRGMTLFAKSGEVCSTL
jgi:hypothetical protein